MGWATGTNAKGRDIGYGIEATCDHPTCEVEIDRGLYYVCGGMHDGDEHGCGKYFCDEHLGYRVVEVDGRPRLAPPQLCDACIERLRAAAELEDAPVVVGLAGPAAAPAHRPVTKFTH